MFGHLDTTKQLWNWSLVRGGCGCSEKPYCFFWVFFFSVSLYNPSRTPKTCFTLGAFVISIATRTALKVARGARVAQGAPIPSCLMSRSSQSNLFEAKTESLVVFQLLLLHNWVEGGRGGLRLEQQFYEMWNQSVIWRNCKDKYMMFFNRKQCSSKNWYSISYLQCFSELQKYWILSSDAISLWE